MEKEKLFLYVVISLISVGTLFVFFGGFYDFLTSSSERESLTGAATTATVGSNVTIAAYFSVSASTNLSEGIQFGSISALPATNANATANNVLNNSQYSIDVSADSNVAVDFCIKADSNLTSSGADIVPLSGYTYNESSTTNLTLPAGPAASSALTFSYVKGTTGVAASGSNYYRFWLDVPSAQAAGTYNNSVSFKAVQTEQSC